jgi:hypothetical protein
VVLIELPVSSEQPPAVMLRIVWIALGALLSAFRSRRDLLLEVLALRQQLAAFKARGKTPCIRAAYRAFWVVLRQAWARWADVLVIVKPETVVLFVIRHGRRHIAHFNVTERPAAAWVVQQLREAFPHDSASKHLVLDRDSIFSPRSCARWRASA